MKLPTSVCSSCSADTPFAVGRALGRSRSRSSLSNSAGQDRFHASDNSGQVSHRLAMPWHGDHKQAEWSVKTAVVHLLPRRRSNLRPGPPGPGCCGQRAGGSPGHSTVSEAHRSRPICRPPLLRDLESNLTLQPYSHVRRLGGFVQCYVAVSQLPLIFSSCLSRE